MSSKNYSPSEEEEFMNPQMLAYFKEKLLTWRSELLNEIESTYTKLQNEEDKNAPDPLDRASLDFEMAVDLRTKDRMRKLIKKIDEALARISAGSYGYCMDTGEPIELERLKARPIAMYSLEAQERHERLEKSHDDKDSSSLV